jgi:predicted glycosyltransferase
VRWVRPVVFFYVQHLLGIGHLRRAALLARAILAEGFELSFVSGGLPAGEIDIGGAKVIQLPPAVAADVQFSAVLDQERRPIDDAWRARRRALLLCAFEATRPDLLLIETFPFGRRQFAFELLPLLDAAKARGIPRAVSLRDILVTKNDPLRLAEIVALIRKHFDRVLVHGDPRLVRLEATFPAASEIADRLAYTGYVAEAHAAPAVAGESEEVVVSAGGGAVGRTLLEAALTARPRTSLATAPWRLITGPNLPEADFAALRAAAPESVAIERFRSDFPALLARSRLSISQAGYNTVMDILATGARALVVPFAEADESEQTLRARLLAERGLLSLVESSVEPSCFAAAIEAALGRPRPKPGAIDLGGARRSARLIDQMIRR